MYAENVELQQSSPTNATLRSPAFDHNDYKCLKFAHIFGGSSRTTLSVYGLLQEQGRAELLWHITNQGPKSRAWKVTEVTVPVATSGLEFVAEQHGKHGVGIDDVSLSPGICTGEI